MRQLKISQSITQRDAGTLEKYLQDIAKEKLLTAEEEVELAQRIKAGDEKAFERLVRSNLRFVVSVAKQYQNQGISLQDLINEGNMGLMKAARRFDETRGFKFISYAVWWIRQSILQAVAEQSRIIRLPANQVGALARLKKVASVLEQQLNRKPTTKEIADEINMPVAKVEALLDINTHVISMDAPIEGQEEGSFLDIYVNDSEMPTDALVEQQSNERAVHKSLDILTPKEQRIVKMYFGIGVPREYSLDEIAMEMDLSRERTRQIRDRALRRLRNEPDSPLYQMFKYQ